MIFNKNDFKMCMICNIVMNALERLKTHTKISLYAISSIGQAELSLEVSWSLFHTDF